MEYILRTRGVCKKYKNHMALNGVDMNVARGDIYGFVGENGSGKTTIIRLITGLISPSAGDFELFGASNKSPEILKARAKVGAVVESPSIYLNMSAYENLKMQCGILGIDDEEKIKSTLSLVGLGYLQNDTKKAGNFSLGMRQRLGIAMALLGNPELLILDEPCHTLSDSERKLVLTLIEKIAAMNISTILHVTHDTDEIMAFEKNILELCPDKDPMYRILDN